MPSHSLTPAPGEPTVTRWQAWLPAQLDARLTEVAPDPPRVIAVDGRSASGKSTLGALLLRTLPDAVLVHTDDVAWNESFFGWWPLLADGILGPYRAGLGVDFRPPAWERHGRSGALVVPSGTPTLIVEGVGASRRELAAQLDVAVWVQSDYAEAERRGLVRDTASAVNGDPDATVAFWHTWMAEELPFLAADRPWERADLLVAGTPTIPLAAGQVAVAEPPGART